MGIISNLVGGLLGGQEVAPVQVPQYVDPADKKTATQIAAEEEAKKKAALIAANAGSGAPAVTVGGGSADVTRKVLLGL